jgi:flagellar biosynthesis protein FlhG
MNSLSEDNSFSDQAQELRRIVKIQRNEQPHENSMLRTIVVLSGKGGVGKTNLSVNLAIALKNEGHKVALLDADLGMANADILCGVTPQYSFFDIIRGDKSIEDILVDTKQGILILPGVSGLKELTEIDDLQLRFLVDSLSLLEKKADFLVIDTGAGIHREVLAFARAADTTLVITTPEPTSIRDAYGVLKSFNNTYMSGNDVRIIVNMVDDEYEGIEVANRIQAVAKKFLGLSVSSLGYILRDTKVEKSVRMREPFLEAFPECAASQCVTNLCSRLLGKSEIMSHPAAAPKGIQNFFLRLIRGVV